MYQSKNSSEKGSAFLELALVLPLLIAFMIGILSTGRLLSQVQNAGQATYLGALFGSELDQSSVETGIKARVKQILSLHRRAVNAPNDSDIQVTVNDENAAQLPRTVRVQMRADLPELFQALDVSMDFTAPLVAQARIPDNIGVPVNPAHLFKCDNLWTQDMNCSNETCNDPCFE